MAIGLWIGACLLLATAALLVKRRPASGLQAVFLGLQTAILAYLMDFGWDLHDATDTGFTMARIMALPNEAGLFLVPLALAGAFIAFLGREAFRDMGKAPWLSLALSWTGALFGAYSFTIFVLTPWRSWPSLKLIVSVLTA